MATVGSMIQETSVGRASNLVRDYAELTKARITTLIVLTAWCGYFFGAHRSGISSWSFGLLHALLGIALVSSGTAALNEVMESNVDARMRRTAMRPIPSGRMSRTHAIIVGLGLTLRWIRLSVYLREPTHRIARFPHCSCLSCRLYPFEENLADMHVRWRFSWRDAGRTRLDSYSRTH